MIEAIIWFIYTEVHCWIQAICLWVQYGAYRYSIIQTSAGKVIFFCEALPRGSRIMSLF